MISFYLKPTPQPQRTSCELCPRRLQVVSTGNGNFGPRLVKFSQTGVAVGKIPSKLGTLFHHQFPKPSFPKLPLPGEMIHLGQRIDFPLICPQFHPRVRVHPSSPCSSFLLLVWATRHQSHLPCMGVEEGFSLFFKAVKSFTIYLWE